MNKKAKGVILATIVGSLFTSSGFAKESSSSQNGPVKCIGGNSCKGKSACQTANNGCKGQNSCKHTGYIMTKSKAACLKKGGHVGK